MQKEKEQEDSKQPNKNTHSDQDPKNSSNKLGDQKNPILIECQAPQVESLSQREKGWFNKVINDLKPQQSTSTPPKVPLDPHAINVEASDKAIDPNSTSRNRVFFYVLEGNNKRKFRSNELNLLEKIQKQEKGDTEEVNLEADQNNENPPQGNTEIQQEQSVVTMRYFSSAEDKAKFGKCRRCKKDGHFQKNCIERFKVNCIICLGNHKFFECGRQTCFNCNEQGHLAKDCTKRSLKCHYCHKAGHLKAECGVLLLNNEGYEPNQYSSHDMRYTLCLNCGKRGHAMCSEENPVPDRLYRDEVVQVKQKKSSSSKKHQDRRQQDGSYIHIVDKSEDSPKKHRGEKDSRAQHSNSRGQQQGNRSQSQTLKKNQPDRHHQQLRQVDRHPQRQYSEPTQQYHQRGRYNYMERQHQSQYQQPHGHYGQQQHGQYRNPHRQDWRQAFNNQQEQYIRQINRNRTGFNRRRV